MAADAFRLSVSFPVTAMAATQGIYKISGEVRTFYRKRGIKDRARCIALHPVLSASAKMSSVYRIFLRTENRMS